MTNPALQPTTAPSLGKAFWAMLRREVTLFYRHRAELANPLVFFLIAITLIPLGVGPEPAMLAVLAPGLIWIMALLANLMSLDGLFRNDFDDGSLEQLLVSPQPLYFMVLAKVIAHWLATGLPLALMSPLLAVMLAMPVDGIWPLVASLLLGTGVLSLIGAVGAALTVALRKGGLLLSLIVMPLYVPILIFGASTVQNAVDGFSYAGPLAILGALLASAMMLAPMASAGALRVGVNG